jgi:tetratricopeptide (TPR) repeat protein
VLQESLTGVRPKLQKSELSFGKTGLPSSNREGATNQLGLSPAVFSIINKSIEPEPKHRYPSAAALQTDLQRHLLDLPLQFAYNPSRIELWRKFRRRNRRLFSLGGLLAIGVALTITAASLGYVWLNNVRTMDARDRHAVFMRSAHHAEAELFLADGGSRDQGLKLVQQAIGSAASASKQPFQAGWLEFLDADRRREVAETSSYLSRLLERNLNSPTANYLDEGFLRKSSTGVKNSEHALTNLEAATEAFYRRDFSGAIKELESGIRLHPQRFVLWFLKGKCQFDLRDYREAERSFAMSLTIQPDSAPALVAQGMSYFGLTQFSEAEQCFRQSLQLQPDYFAAHYNLALVLEKQLRFEEALDQLKLCEQLRSSSTRVWMTRSRVARSAGNAELANHSLSLVRTTEPDEPDGWVLRGLARLSESPDKALQDFAEGQKFPSTRFSAGQNRAHVLSELLGRPAEAIDVLSTLIEEDPNFLPALAGRAVLLARLNHSKQALADLELLKEKPLSPQLHYQIACVYALLSQSDQRHERQALEHLAIASQPAYGGQIIASDKDLDPLRKNAKFETMLEGIMTGNSLRLNQ